MKRWLLCVILCLILGACAPVYTVNVNISDSGSGSPVANALVTIRTPYVFDVAPPKPAQGTTNALGDTVVEIEGEEFYIIRVTAPGHRNQYQQFGRIPANGDPLFIGLLFADSAEPGTLQATIRRID
jgi:hypothetical protein